jgi:serine phosphatase RsbU (regulator of sigma subunit)
MSSQNQQIEILQQQIAILTQTLVEKDNYIKEMQKNIANEQLFSSESYAEILTQNEELQQTQEELLAQREFIENQKQSLEKVNKKMAANEQILLKAYEKIKGKEKEVQEQKILLEVTNAEILTQNEELQQTQEELLAQREFIENQKINLEKNNKKMAANEQILAKAYEKIKLKESELQQQKHLLELSNAEILVQNEELQQAQEELLAQREFIEKQYSELKFKNNKIKSSIQAALLIQQAILPYTEKMQTILGNHFVIYQPKDIVSGDFWWLHTHASKTILAVVDCTGHGVAGAFMTLIANTLLDKIIILSNIYAPAEILQKLHQEIQLVLRQNETKNSYGMDMSVLCIEKQANTEQYQIEFAGAKRSIYVIENEQLTELKGTRKGIGGNSKNEVVFGQEQILVKKNTWIYAGTDGLTDQNDVDRKRFGENKLKEILLANYQKTAAEQQQVLLSSMQVHKQIEEQRDDILFMGFELQ